MLGRTNAGGGSGGAIKPENAILLVTVPTGSTVTAVKGSISLTPTMWVTAADASLDCALFVIPASKFDAANPWTITATDGTNTASDTILITTNKEYELELSYNLYLFKSGVGLTDGRSVVIQTGNGTLTTVSTVPFDNTDGNGTTFVHLDRMYVSNKNIGLIFYFPAMIDVTDYSALHVELEQTGAYSSDRSKWVVGVGPDIPGSWSAYGTWTARLDYNLSPTGRGVATVDISNVTGQQYIKVGPINYSNGAPIGYCYNVWLE